MKLQDLGVIDPYTLSIEDRIELVIESKGALVEFLKNSTFINLQLLFCEALEYLPKSIEVRGYIDLEGCSSISHFPSHLKHVKGFLCLEGCSSLKSLPKNLTINGSLYIGGCSSLKELPTGLTVDGNIYYTDETGISELPENINLKGDFLLT